jgi:hypothetical protein
LSYPRVGEVRRAPERREALIRSFRERLASLGDDARILDRTGASRGVRARASHTNRRAHCRPRRRNDKASGDAEDLGSNAQDVRKQGRCLAALRPLPKTARQKIKWVREMSGLDAAIAAGRQLAARGRRPSAKKASTTS